MPTLIPEEAKSYPYHYEQEPSQVRWNYSVSPPTRILRGGGLVGVEPGLQILNRTKVEYTFRQCLESLKRQPTDALFDIFGKWTAQLDELLQKNARAALHFATRLTPPRRASPRSSAIRSTDVT